MLCDQKLEKVLTATTRLRSERPILRDSLKSPRVSDRKSLRDRISAENSRSPGLFFKWRHEARPLWVSGDSLPTFPSIRSPITTVSGIDYWGLIPSLRKADESHQ